MTSKPVSLLIDKLSSVECPPHVQMQGFTPLHTAASHSSFQAHLVLADLLEGGADMEAQDNEGRTPLLLALEGNRKEAIDVLIATGMHMQLTHILLCKQITSRTRFCN